MADKLSEVTQALEVCWQAIQAHHPTVRDAVVVVYRHQKNDRRGHYHPDQWQNGGGVFDEVHISSLILGEDFSGVLRTLLHEACHSRATGEGIKETSRDGQYHNRRFEALAQDLGLEVVRDPKIGRRTTGLLPGVLEQYADALPNWDEERRLYQDLYQGNGKASAYQAVRLECPACGRILRMSQRGLDLGPVGCLPCGVEFVES
jgi:hypothetical protein